MKTVRHLLILAVLLFVVPGVLAVAPTGADNTIPATEDVEYTFKEADFGFKDTDKPAHLLRSVKITTLETKGALQLSGKDVTLNQEIILKDITDDKLKFVPVANANGKAYTTFKFTVKDTNDEVSKVANTITIDVKAVNDLPTAADSKLTIAEDASKSLTASNFKFSDVADKGTLASVKITSLPKGTLVLGKTAVKVNDVITAAKIKDLKYTPVLNEHSKDAKTVYSTLQFTVNDGTENSAKANKIEFIVTADNDAPTVSKPSDVTIIETVKTTKAITAADVDDEVSKLSVKEVQVSESGKNAFSVPKWVSHKDLTLTITPQSADAGKAFDVKVIVQDDDNKASKPAEFKLSVGNAFTLSDFTVKVNDKAAAVDAVDKKYKINLDDKVTVSYTYKNNLPSDESTLDKILIYLFGNVDITATSSTNKELYTSSKTKLYGGDSATDTFSFVAKESGNDYKVTLKAVGKTGKTAAGGGNTFITPKEFTFDVKAPDYKASFVDKSLKLVDEELTCSKLTDLKLDIKNSGAQAIDTKVHVFSKSGSFDTTTGAITTTGTTLSTFSVPTIASGKTSSVSVPIDATGLSGEQKLYVYLTSGNFVKADKTSFLGDSKEITLKNVASCLNTKEVAKQMIIARGKIIPTSIDLLAKDAKGEYKYISENKDTADDLVFSLPTKDAKGNDIVTQSDLKLVTCKIVKNSNKKLAQLECGIPKAHTVGESELTLHMTKSSKTITEKVKVVVGEHIALSDVVVKVNTAKVTADAKTLKYSVNPEQKVTVSYKYTNTLAGTDKASDNNFAIGNILVTASTNADSKTDISKYKVSKAKLAAGASATDSFEFTIPANFAENELTLTLKVAGKSFGPESQEVVSQREFDFDVIKKDGNGFIVSKSVKLADESLTCNKHTTLDLKVTNTGKKDIDGFVQVFTAPATISDAGKVTSTGVQVANEKVVKVAAGKADVAITKVPIDASKVPAGKHTLYVYLTSDGFNNNGKPFMPPVQTVELKAVGACLKTDEIEKQFVIPKNKNSATTLNLLSTDAVTGEYLYINEDKGTGASMVFDLPTKDDKGAEIKTQTNDKLTACKILTKTKLECSKPETHADGTNELTLHITKDGKTIQENIKVHVAPSLKFTSLSIDGKTAVEVTKKLPLTVQPLDKISVKFKAKNHKTIDVIGFKAQLTGTNAKDFTAPTKAVELSKIASGIETAELEYVFTVPADAKPGNKEVTFEVLAKSPDGADTFKVSHTFGIKVEKSPAKIILEAALAKDKDGKAISEFTCNTDVTIDVVATNTGNAKETDAVITVRDGTTELAKKDKFVIEAGKSFKHKFDKVSVAGKTGTHTLTVELAHKFTGKVAAYKVPITLDVTKKACLNSKFTPAKSTLTVADGQPAKFTVNTVDTKFDANKISWTAYDSKDTKKVTVQSGTGKTFIDFEKGKIAEKTWTVTVTDKPVDGSKFALDTSKITDIKKVQKLKLLKENSQVEFIEDIDLSNVHTIEDVVKIKKQQNDHRIISIDSKNAAALNKKATITLTDFPSGKTVILKYDGFGDDLSKLGIPKVCTEALGCSNKVHAGSTLTFDVSGFSTYVVVNEIPAALKAGSSKVQFSTIFPGQDSSTTFTLQNEGTIDTISGISATTSNVETGYVISVTNLPTTLAPVEQKTVTVKVSVPATEKDGKTKTVGTLTIASDKGNLVLPVEVSPTSGVSIKDFEVNDKSNGKFDPQGDNEIMVEIDNDLDEDLDDTEVVVTILDVDGNDLDESDEKDISDKDSEKFNFNFDLSGEDLEEEEYDVLVEVFAETDDGVEHEAEKKFTVKVKRENHKLIFSDVSLSPSEHACGIDYTSLDVTAKNVGKRDEDNVKIVVKSTGLGVDLKQDNLNIDRYSDSDNTHTTSFNIDVREKAVGTHPITVQLYRDGDLEETKSLSFKVNECASTKSATQTQQVLTGSLQAQMQQQLAAAQQKQPSSVVQGSFTEGDTYLVLLGILVVLLFVVFVLMLAMVAVKKR